MKKRGKKYTQAKNAVEKGKTYSAEEAIDLIKKTNQAKFDAAIEVHLKLGLDKKLKQTLRGTTHLPFGTGKKLRICVFTTPEKQTAAKEAGADIVGAEEMIKETKCFNILKGFRGKKFDIKALVQILLKTSRMLEENQEIVELDINPVIVLSKGAVAADARIVID